MELLLLELVDVIKQAGSVEYEVSQFTTSLLLPSLVMMVSGRTGYRSRKTCVYRHGGRGSGGGGRIG